MEAFLMHYLGRGNSSFNLRSNLTTCIFLLCLRGPWLWSIQFKHIFTVPLLLHLLFNLQHLCQLCRPFPRHFCLLCLLMYCTDSAAKKEKHTILNSQPLFTDVIPEVFQPYIFSTFWAYLIKYQPRPHIGYFIQTNKPGDKKQLRTLYYRDQTCFSMH